MSKVLAYFVVTEAALEPTRLLRRPSASASNGTRVKLKGVVPPGYSYPENEFDPSFPAYGDIEIVVNEAASEHLRVGKGYYVTLQEDTGKGTE